MNRSDLVFTGISLIPPGHLISTNNPMDGDTTAAHRMNMPNDRSVWGVETDAFKTAFRDYLREMQGDDADRDELIRRLLWCVDVWDRHRRKYFPDERCDRPLLFPFIDAPGQAGGREKPATYKLFGSQGQPSVIAIQHNLLMATSDLTIWKSKDGERRLVLSKRHALRDRYIERLIVHQLLKQYLVESALDGVRREYIHQTRSGAAANGGEFKTYKGHGTVFANHANYLNHHHGMPLLGDEFEPSRLRHYKPRHAKSEDRKRPSCSWFGTLDMFFVWDPDAEGLTDEQLCENDARMALALDWYDGAVELVTTEAPPLKTFEAPFDSSCADTCINELSAYDKAHGTGLVWDFITRVWGEHSEVSRETRDVPHSASAEESIEYADGSVHTIDELMDDIGLGDVPVKGGKPTLTKVYPLSKPAVSLAQLETDLAEAKAQKLTKAEFAKQRFGHSRGDQLSRHMKRLREAVA